MKIKEIIVLLVGAVAFQQASAGDCNWCPPAPDKCGIDESPDCAGNIAVGYETDYIFYGVRLARDSVWADVSYTIDALPLPLTVGVWHLTTLGSGVTSPAFDETDLYAAVELPAIAGFDVSLGYTQYFFPTIRTAQNAAVGDSTGEIYLSISREIMSGLSAYYRVGYDFNQPSALAAQAGQTLQDQDSGAWIHKAGLDYEMEITDCLSTIFSAGVLYTDNYWNQNIQQGTANTSGWNSYYAQVALPVALNCRTTITPYIGYNGSPDGWVTDGANGLGIAGNGGANANDVFHGGVSINVSF